MVIATIEFEIFSCPSSLSRREPLLFRRSTLFEHSSGNQYPRGTRVSHLANKQMKKLLQMAALSVVSVKEKWLITTTESRTGEKQDASHKRGA